MPILQNCLPAFLALFGAFVAIWVLLVLSPARANVRRLLELHRCEHGGVQSLAFVLVLPIFITIVTFIVQISQLLIGMMVVNYASFAAARSASVWIPVHLGDFYEPANVVETGNYLSQSTDDNGQVLTTHRIEPDTPSEKLRRVRMAAVMGCAPISPSRDYGLSPLTAESDDAAAIVPDLYDEFVPDSARNNRTQPRLYNKIAYSDQHTVVIIEWRDTGNDSFNGPTYNPRDHEDSAVPEYNPAEVGWQDAITVYVVHRYHLLSGAGRSLAGRLSSWQRLPLRVQEQIPADWISSTVGTAGQPVVLIAGTATMTNEGLKPLRRHTLTIGTSPGPTTPGTTPPPSDGSDPPDTTLAPGDGPTLRGSEDQR